MWIFIVLQYQQNWLKSSGDKVDYLILLSRCITTSGEGDMAGSWWGGWLQTAKEKSTAALDMVRKDLAEFGCTMQQDTGRVVGVTSTTLKESLKAENTSAAREKLTKGLNTFLEGISKALVVPPDDDGQIPIIAPASDCYDRTKARIHAIQVDPATYINEPSGSPETYSMWCEGFDLDSKKGEVSDLLVSKVEVRGLYTKLVPSRVSHIDFWQRYFYKLHQLDVDQARKEALMKRADISKADDSISWDDDWSDEAAEDSGSDWEKLPRPSQQRPSRDSPTSFPAAPPSSTLATASPAPERSKDSDSSAESSADKSAAQPPAASSSAAEFQDISLEERKHSESSETSTSEEEAVSPVETSSSFSSSDPPVSASSSSPIQETSSSGSHRPNAEAFKEDLKLSAGEEASPALPQAVIPAETPSLELPSTQCLPPEREASTHVEPEASQPADSEPQLADASAQSNPPSASLPEIASPAPEMAQQSAVLGSQIQQETEQPAAMPVPTSTPAAESCAAEASSVQQALSVAVPEESTILKTTERGDLVMVGSDHGSPLSNASESKVVSDVDDEWEQDLDIELTEEDMKAAEELAKKLGDNFDLEDDWESWE